VAIIQDADKQQYRGVVCRSCRQPISLPAIVVNIHAAIQDNGADSDGGEFSRVFSLRCRSCQSERPYQTSEVVTFDGVPKVHLSRSRSKQRETTVSGDVARAANA
jgi:hypothetical protein